MLTDCYKKIEEGYITLSGKCIGVSGVAAEVISSISGGNENVEFKPVNDFAISLVKNKLNKEYVDNAEGFIISVDDKVTVYANSDRAKLFASCAIKDMYDKALPKGVWWSYPLCEHRSIRVFLPPKNELDYFYNLIEQMIHLGYNELHLQISGAMEFKRHPEINKAWLAYSASVHSSPEKYTLVSKAYYRTKNAVHTCNAGGAVYTQDELRSIVKYCKDRYINVVPEVPSLSHSEYFLIAHPELRECDDEPFASTACPSNPELNKLVFDLYDEVIDVFEPSGLHIGHDEWWVMCVCDKCKGKNPNELYVNNVLESYNYLKKRGIKTYMWADKLVHITDKLGERHGASGKDVYAVPTQKNEKTVEVLGKEHQVYDIYWFEAPEWVKNEGFHQIIYDLDCAHMLPSDITYVNWYHVCDPAIRDTVFYRQGKDMVLGNTEPSKLTNYKQRFMWGAQGFSISCWGETSEENMQSYGTVYEMGYGSIIAWNHSRTEQMHEANVLDTLKTLYELRNRDVINNAHLEVIHTVAKKWEKGRKFYFSMERVDRDYLTLGEYVVTYKDGEKESFPVIFSINISHRDVNLERGAGIRNWDYMTDPDYGMVASKCNIIKENDGIWYKTVMPLRGEIDNCIYIPKEGFEDFVEVKSIKSNINKL